MGVMRNSDLSAQLNAECVEGKSRSPSASRSTSEKHCQLKNDKCCTSSKKISNLQKDPVES
jgi:hypothetical protein